MMFLGSISPGASILLIGVILILMSSAIYGLWWAIKGGQYSDFNKGATSIFDADEPVGRRTDAFPDKRSSPRQ